MSARTVTVCAVCIGVVTGARADGPPALDEAALEAIARGPAGSRTASDRSWLFNDPATTAAPGNVVGLLGATYGGNSLTRPFANNLSTSGGLVEAGAEVGVSGRVSVLAIGAQGQDGAGSSQTGAMLGLRWSLLPESSRRTRLVLSGGVLRELQGNNGAWARLAFGHDEGHARFTASVHGERVFAGGRDSVDVMVTAGANLRLAESLRAGIEYVGQDLEGVLEDEAEGGARHVLGPSLSAAFLGDRLSIAAGPAVALGAAQAHLLGRIALACQF